ncbi:hypothetical protein Tco_0924219 [Tanacetum coccineum]|uniref:Retrovirus-related Pol polyprotein from transposon TNT 1-94-like beta-barrel domain-containing protein n=1 Tax=Tanacetum coccineum TaxID=301880 RepID=A0ABQ5D371_9ASTR
MQDKNMVINELKKLILVTKGKSVETQFDKPSVVRQPNAQRIPKPSVLGKPTPFSNSPEMRKLKKSVKVVPFIRASKPKRKANKSVATPHKKTVASDTTIQKSKSYHKELYENTNQNEKIVQLILFIVDSGCTKHMTGNLKLLCNFVEKFLGTVRFGNDQFAPILGYGDLIQGNVTIKRVLVTSKPQSQSVLVGQFCDAIWRLHFRKSTLVCERSSGNNLRNW